MLHVPTAAEKKAEKLAKKWAKEDRQAKMSEAEHQDSRQDTLNRLGAWQVKQQKTSGRVRSEWVEEIDL